MVVTIKSPKNNAKVSGTVQITAVCSTPIAQMQFWLNGQHLGAPVSSAPYRVNWNTAIITSGKYTIQAQAKNANGVFATSQTLHVTVTGGTPTPPTPTPPVCTITAPVSGSTISNPGTLVATATDNVAVLDVQFKIDGVNVGPALTSSPYRQAWTPVSYGFGTHIVTATARNAAALTNTSTVTVLVPQPVVNPPTVTLTAPSGTVSGTVALTATAGQTVINLQFSVNGSALGPLLTVAPFTTDWNTLNSSNGFVVVTATAYDAQGASATSSHTVSVSNAGVTGVLSQSDITYVGCFRMPATGTDTTFAYGWMTGRVVSGVLHLLLYQNHSTTIYFPGDSIIEVVDPGTYSTNYTTAPRCTLATYWGNIYHGKRVSWTSDGTLKTLDYAVPAGLYWNEDTGLLYWTYADQYNVSGGRDWALGASSLDNPSGPTTTAYGPWRVTATDGDGSTFYGPWRTLYIFLAPDGTLAGGSQPMSGNASAPWGPDMYAGIDWPTAGTPAGYGNPDLHQPDRYLEYYFMGNQGSANFVDANGLVHGNLRSFRRTNEQALFENVGGATPLRVNPALNGGVGSWAEQDGTSGAVWLQLTHKRGVIFMANICGAVSQTPSDPLACHEWYATGLNNFTCSHGIVSHAGITGPVRTAGFPAFIIFDPDDLTDVKNGDTTDYTVDPVSLIDLESTYGIRTADIGVIGAGKSIGGAYWDATRNYLFVIAGSADNSRAGDNFLESLIHVFHIADTP